MHYEILEHPSELRIKVYGSTFEELFCNAALAMADVLKKERQESRQKERIKIEAVDLNSLLVDFLSEILARSQINMAVYTVESVKFSEQAEQVDRPVSLEAKMRRCPVEYFDEDIKAVTYEDLDIRKRDNQWQTIVVFDV